MKPFQTTPCYLFMFYVSWSSQLKTYNSVGIASIMYNDNITKYYTKLRARKGLSWNLI